MQSAEEKGTDANGRLIMAKLADGEDVFSSLHEVAAVHKIESGAVLFGIGMLKDFEIGFFGPEGYVKHAYADRHELLAFHGSIAIHAEPKFHIHVAVAAPDHSVLGGHLFRAKAAVVNEICLARFSTIKLDRKLNPTTTLQELQISY